ncbi:MAG TPA: ABC transporter ATP-binding protein [Aggregatilineales bacterium]|nr:ABC transporter ATP-binding protein [Anaerolineales bacterium]HRE49263.1 ABC transporter ATP-binding protein [Aggregatilineales bacterium]
MFHGGGWFSFLTADSTKRPKIDIALVRRVFAYARPYRGRIILVLLSITLTTFLGLLSPALFRQLIDVALPNGNTAMLNLLAVGIVAIPIFSGVIAILQRRLTAGIGEGVIYELRVALYTHLQKMSLRFFTHAKPGELISRLNNDVVGAQSAINNTIISTITNLLAVVGTLAAMLSLEWRLTILGLIVVPLFILPAWRVGQKLRTLMRTQSELNAQMNAMINETLNISGALLVKLFGRLPEEVDRFGSRAAGVRDIGVQRAVTGSLMFVSLGLISTVGVGITYWVGGHLVVEGVFTVGLIVAFVLYLTQVYGPLQALANAPVEFATSMVSFERVFEIIDLPIEIAEKPDALTLSEVRGEITFDQVTFKYLDEEGGTLSEVRRGAEVRGVFSLGERPTNGTESDSSLPHTQARTVALENVSFTAKAGQLIALVGPSGAGKTTITYLLPRLYDPTSGRVLLDGHDLRDLKLSTITDSIGMVTQENYLFHDTIRTNLLYARPGATDHDLHEACRAANIHDFIMGLPNGYDTMVGERGYRLSGGEKQRIAIARVILKNPRILVLDEATSHLDSQSEALIQTALERVMTGRTSLVIAHRLSTILAADHILVLDRGQIVEQGSHGELVAQGGLYATLYETQFRGDQTPA